MQLFSADAKIYIKFFFFQIFCPRKIEKNTPKSCSESTQTPFSHGPAHSPKLISHIMKFRDQTSVLLSVEEMFGFKLFETSQLKFPQPKLY